MRIVEISDSAVTLSSGAQKSANEVMWNYRSECCQAPLDFVGGALICAYCERSDIEIVHKSAIISGGIQIAEAISALPGEARDRAAQGYYRAIDDPSIKLVHVFDRGGEYELPDLPQEMRR